MLRKKILFRTIGTLLSVEAIMMLICLGISVSYREDDQLAFGLSFLIVVVASVILRFLGRHTGNSLNRRESFFIVAATWIVFSVLGMFPLLLSGYCSSVTDAFFETMSGFTTTGTTIINKVDALPHGLLFWRSLTQFVGGLGIVFFTIAMIPSDGSDSNVRLFSAEVTGVTHEKLHPRIRTTVGRIFSLYAFMTVACAISLYLVGMDWFDSINHAMTTMATGGFSTHDSGIMYFDSASVECIIMLFMFLSSLSFYLLYAVIQRRSLKMLTHNSEFKFYILCILTVSIIVIAANCIYSGNNILDAIRSALFNVISIQSSTGYVSNDISVWWHPLWYLIFFVMITGGCSGSTSGGIKCVRSLTLIKTAINQYRHILHPNVVRPVRINGRGISEALERNLLAFVFWFLALTFMGAAALSILGYDYTDSINVVICNISNTGAFDTPSCSPQACMQSLPPIGKWICAFLMLAGRLELFPLLLPLAPSFWKNE